MAMSDKPDAELAIKAPKMAYQQRGGPSGMLFHSDQLQPGISATTVALSHDPEYESAR